MTLNTIWKNRTKAPFEWGCTIKGNAKNIRISSLNHNCFVYMELHGPEGSFNCLKGFKLIDADSLIALRKTISFIYGSYWHLLATRNSLCTALIIVWLNLQKHRDATSKGSSENISLNIVSFHFSILQWEAPF